MDNTKIVDEIFALYETYGSSEYLGEDVTKTQHSIQCAMCAERDGASQEIVLAAFLHDIGHLIGMKDGLPDMITAGRNIGTMDHDIIGGSYLRERGFPELICHIVAGHVQAKRYLVYKHKNYFDKLSEASKQTLVHQGGAMSPAEAKTFEISETFDAIIKMRTWDEQAKDKTVEEEPLDKYKQLCRDILSKDSS